MCRIIGKLTFFVYKYRINVSNKVVEVNVKDKYLGFYVKILEKMMIFYFKYNIIFLHHLCVTNRVA